MSDVNTGTALGACYVIFEKFIRPSNNPISRHRYNMSTLSQPGPSAVAPGGGVLLTPTPAQLQAAFDSSIWYLLSLWPALHTAVQNSWGGPSSADKRDWFAGAVSELLTSNPGTDHDDLVVFLLQIMQDEFDCMVEDESEEDIAQQILGVRKRVLEEGDIVKAREIEERWKSRGKVKVEFREAEDDEDSEDEFEGFGDVDGDVEMEDAVPELVEVKSREKMEPEVDEDGFTKVTKKKR